MKFKTRNVLTAVLLMIFSVMASVAQTSRGTVTGTITDNSGAVISNATVVLVDKATNVRRETKSNDQGMYRFDAVNLGDYSIEVEAAGFSKASVTNVTVQAARSVDVGVELRPGSTAETVTVEGTADQALQTTEQVRVASITARKVADLPIVGQNSLNLMLTAPGVVTTDQGGSTNSGIGAVNGSRPRSNSFLIDGVENNDISINGPAFTPTNNDAIAEVSVQTANFSAEFGRAGGAVVNQVTKSGSNTVHGTAAWVYRSHVFNAEDRDERNAGGGKGPFVRHTPAFTIGGPVVIPGLYNGRDRSFFFGGAQWDRLNAGSLQSAVLRVPTAAGVATLQGLAAAGCSQAQLYLDYLDGLVAPTATSNISLAVPAAMFAVTGSCNGTARTGMLLETGTTTRSAPSLFTDNNHVARFDHKLTDNQQLSVRWLYDSQAQNNGGTIGLSRFSDADFVARTMTGALTHTWVINPTTTNEFRFNYGRIAFNFPLASSEALAALPTYTFQGTTAPTAIGPAATFPQGRTANNWQYQNVVSKVVGSHQLRFGADILRQLARQTAPANVRGAFTYNTVTGVTSFANFLDNFSGNNANPVTIGFGTPTYRPNLFRQAYFFQDSWRVTSNLTLNLGVRYENFGQPANIFQFPVVTTDPAAFGVPSKVKHDNNNFGPTVGFAWTPGSGNWLFGDQKTVIRGGFQVTYDTFFNNLLSNMAAGNPNLVSNVPIPSNTANAATPRGVAQVSTLLATVTPAPLNPTTNAASQFPQNMVNPYTMRHSLGIQRELPWKMIADVSYVGTLSRKQFRTVQLNPLMPNATNTAAGTRMISTIGSRTPRVSNSNANYNGLQTELRRGFSETPVGGLTFNASYTWSKTLSTVDEVFATNGNPGTQGSSQRLLLTNSNLDYGPSDLDVRHVFQGTALWDIRGPKSGVAGQILGGWSLGFVVPIQSGFAFEVVNGFDRDLDGGTADRPDIGSMSAPITSRAIAVTAATCGTGFLNVDTNVCVNRTDVRWIGYGAVDLGSGQGTRKDPDQNTAGRNSARTPGSILVNMNVIKKFNLTERWKLEYRAEIFNLANHENFNYAPFDITVAESLADIQSGNISPFLDYTSGRPAGALASNSRNMRMGLKIIF